MAIIRAKAFFAGGIIGCFPLAIEIRLSAHHETSIDLSQRRAATAHNKQIGYAHLTTTKLLSLLQDYIP